MHTVTQHLACPAVFTSYTMANPLTMPSEMRNVQSCELTTEHQKTSKRFITFPTICKQQVKVYDY